MTIHAIVANLRCVADNAATSGATLRGCAAIGIVAMAAITGAGAASAQACRSAEIRATTAVTSVELYRFEAGRAVAARTEKTAGIAARIEDCGDNSYFFYRDTKGEMFLIKRAALLVPEKCLAQSTVKAGTPGAGACSP